LAPSAEAFHGAALVLKTFGSQIQTAAQRFAFQAAAFVDDRGMIKSHRVEGNCRAPGFPLDGRSRCVIKPRPVAMRCRIRPREKCHGAANGAANSGKIERYAIWLFGLLELSRRQGGPGRMAFGALVPSPIQAKIQPPAAQAPAGGFSLRPRIRELQRVARQRSECW